MTTATYAKDPRVGVTLYSFTRLFHAREMSMEDLLREVARRGLGPKVEIVGFQSIRNFPVVDDAYVSWFRNLFDELQLEPAAIGGNADGGIRRDRRLTNDEMVDYMAAQIKVAARLGFPVMRVQYSLKPDDMERLLPICEQENIRIGVEVHAHHTLHHPEIQAYLEKFAALDTPYLGFVPDWGAAMEHLPASLFERCRRDGVPEEAIAYVEAYWDRCMANGPILDDRLVHEEMTQVMGDVEKLSGGHSTATALALSATGLLGKGRAEDWAEILPYAVHTHGKLYDVEPDDAPQSVPLRKVLTEYDRAGYTNSISIEWEGFHWNIWSDPFEIVDQAQRKVTRIIDEIRAGKESAV